MPLPQHGMFWKSIGWLLDPESPLYIKPEPSLSLIKWLMNFSTNMTHAKMNQYIEVLSEISKESLRIYRNLSERYNFLFSAKGTSDGKSNKRKSKIWNR
jgi:D-amino-acid dehydrogenase